MDRVSAQPWMAGPGYRKSPIVSPRMAWKDPCTPWPLKTPLLIQPPDVALVAVNKTFPGGVKAVIDFTAVIEHGEFVAMLGPSGCGKTTILRMIGGLEEATTGSIFIAGTEVTDLPPSHRDTAMMFQSFALFSPSHRVSERRVQSQGQRSTEGAKSKRSERYARARRPDRPR